MDFFSILVGAACGAIAGAAGALASKAVKAQRSKQIVTVVVFVALFVGLLAIARSTIIADRRAEVQKSAFEAETASNPAFQAVADYAPDEMDKINAYLDRAVAESHSATTVENTTRQMMAAVIAARLSRASDAAVLNSVNLTIDQVEWLYDRGDDTCFRMLHPDVAGGIQVDSVFNDELLRRDFDSTAMILASYDDARSVPDPARAATLFNPVYLQLLESHGEQALMSFADVANPDIDRRQVCQMTSELLGGILALPADDSLMVLRWMFDAAAAQP